VAVAKVAILQALNKHLELLTLEAVEAVAVVAELLLAVMVAQV
jgi:hypothetical protein